MVAPRPKWLQLDFQEKVQNCPNWPRLHLLESGLIFEAKEFHTKFGRFPKLVESSLISLVLINEQLVDAFHEMLLFPRCVWFEDVDKP